MTAIHDPVPDSRDTLVAALEQVDGQIRALWERIDGEAFFAPPVDGGWTPAQNLKHLARSTRAVTGALGLPRIVPRLLFGRPRGPARGFVEIRDLYRSKLAAGAQAGRYAPPAEPVPAHPQAARRALVDDWRRVVPGMLARLERWDDAALDGCQLPHPILGKLTCREMLYFTLYHLGHHAQVVAGRFPAS